MRTWRAAAAWVMLAGCGGGTEPGRFDVAGTYERQVQVFCNTAPGVRPGVHRITLTQSGATLGGTQAFTDCSGALGAPTPLSGQLIGARVSFALPRTSNASATFDGLHERGASADARDSIRGEVRVYNNTGILSETAPATFVGVAP